MTKENKTIKEIYKCKNCSGDLKYIRGLGWCHIVATGCVNPQVNKEDWKCYLKNNKTKIAKQLKK